MNPQLANPLVLIAAGVVVTLDNFYSWATFNNSGAGVGTIDFGLGQIVPINAGETITMPYIARPYGQTIVDGTLTTIKIVFMR